MAAPLKQRLCFGQLPVPSEKADLFWSLKQAELRSITDAQLTALLLGTPEFQEVVIPMLDRIDQRNRTGYGNTMGRPPRFSSLQLESVLLYRRVAGLESVKETRERLFCDPEAHALLNLEGGLPSLKTMSRYIRERLEASERADAYRELDRRLRQRVYQLPGFDEEARILGMDGSQHGTRYTAPIPVYEKTRKTGHRKERIGWANDHIAKGQPGAVTAETAGFVGGHHAKSGKGWQLLGLWTEHGTLVAWDISPLNESEKPAAERVLATYEREVLPHRDTQTLSVLTADSGFNSGKIREQAQRARAVPNIHKASHKSVPNMEKEETENAEERNKNWRPFRHHHQPQYSNWRANGHEELRCKCGAGKTKRVFELGTSLSIATKGCCETCGNVRITVGQWRLARNGKHYVRCRREDRPDPSIGNSLTFNDGLSKEYGKDRFGFGESVHATIERRFGLLQDKSWTRDITEAETEFAIAFSAISVLLLERYAQQATATQVGNNEAGGSGGSVTSLSQAPVAPLPLAA